MFDNKQILMDTAGKGIEDSFFLADLDQRAVRCSRTYAVPGAELVVMFYYQHVIPV